MLLKSAISWVAAFSLSISVITEVRAAGVDPIEVAGLKREIAELEARQAQFPEVRGEIAKRESAALREASVVRASAMEEINNRERAMEEHISEDEKAIQQALRDQANDRTPGSASYWKSNMEVFYHDMASWRAYGLKIAGMRAEASRQGLDPERAKQFQTMRAELDEDERGTNLKLVKTKGYLNNLLTRQAMPVYRPFPSRPPSSVEAQSPSIDAPAAYTPTEPPQPSQIVPDTKSISASQTDTSRTLDSFLDQTGEAIVAEGLNDAPKTPQRVTKVAVDALLNQAEETNFQTQSRVDPGIAFAADFVRNVFKAVATGGVGLVDAARTAGRHASDTVDGFLDDFIRDNRAAFGAAGSDPSPRSTPATRTNPLLGF